MPAHATPTARAAIASPRVAAPHAALLPIFSPRAAAGQVPAAAFSPLVSPSGRSAATATLAAGPAVAPFGAFHQGGA